MRGLNGNDAVAALDGAGRDISELIGSKLFIGNVELRIPFTGPKQLALIKSRFLFSDLNLFVDGGLAFTDFNQLGGGLEGEEGTTFGPVARPIFTAGVSTRINVFGQLVVEPYFARPLIKDASWAFGVNLLPGW